MSAASGFRILSAPRMSRAGFARVLEQAGSPAAREAFACYAAFAGAGVDPAVGLAVFQHESTFGRYGRAAGNRSWGNLRHADGSFVAYPTWTAGAAGAAALLHVYGANLIRRGVDTSTTLTFPYVWAPSADHNSPAAYGAAVTAAVARWAAEYPPAGAHPSPPPPPRPTSGHRYTVRPGDSLSSIAARLGIRPAFGVPAWERLYRANRSAVGPDPSLIHPGLVLRWP